MEVRELTVHDYDAVLALWQASPGVGVREGDDSREGIARYLARNPGCSFVALEGGEAVGSVLAGQDGRRGYIYHACVRPDLRRSGLARRLLELAVEALRGQGIRKAGLICFADNAVGLAFWEAMGWTWRGDVRYLDFELRSSGDL